jgi:hypothetical protein
MGRPRKWPPGLTSTPFYRVWINIHSRCSNPNSSDHWPFYGARGITVCDRWADFANFAEDMYPTYQEGLTIERIDNNGPYSPENCRWATTAEQSLNKRSNHLLTYEGRTMTIMEWSIETGIHHHALYSRIKRGWSIERALTTH